LAAGLPPKAISIPRSSSNAWAASDSKNRATIPTTMMIWAGLHGELNMLPIEDIAADMELDEGAKPPSQTDHYSSLWSKWTVAVGR
jgi:hypothetical protein